MHRINLWIMVLAFDCLGLQAHPSHAQASAELAATPTKPSNPEPTSVTFRYQPASAGAKLWQHVTFFANTLTTYKQSGQVISRRQIFATCEQIRRVLVREAGPVRHVVEVTYEKAQEIRCIHGQEPFTEPQAVADKSYLVSREQDELQVRDKQGNPVSQAEERIVKHNMQAVGCPNALAEFLHGRTMHVGQLEVLPADVVEQLLGWQDSFGAVQSVTLRLDRVKRQQSTQIAECRLEIKCAPIPELDHATNMQGTIDLETDTCRVQATALKADLNAREQRGPAEYPFFVTHEGQANLHSQVRLIR